MAKTSTFHSPDASPDAIRCILSAIIDVVDEVEEEEVVLLTRKVPKTFLSQIIPKKFKPQTGLHASEKN